ncbi:hypothetical protein JF770_14335 [Mycobacterium intracellulare]|uniref:hypothetical protein n=1 Tax=Mycobacterium intracellulare TaxID=1767 RepID=UPI001CD9639C|nr:hypothetical protein [Mycobacterium intracellulare]MCA2304746.1 hypothetical protein [Mycobacterium intracellulare]MCA2347622.1 hypothetical protein [Mycobacterium intracellulare]
MTLVEGLRDEETAGAAGCSKDKKLHNISLSLERMKRMKGRDGERGPHRGSRPSIAGVYRQEC